jgi:parvulin-like peptidyl-prolyl isomerase
MLKVAMIPVETKASSQTTRMVEQQARLFKEQADKNGYDEAAKTSNYRVIADAPPMEKKGQQLFGDAIFTDWVFSADVGDISKPFKIRGAKMTVVAQLTEIQPKGFKPFEEVKDPIKAELAKSKWVETAAARAKALRAQLMPGDPMDKLAAQDSNLRPLVLAIGPAESVGVLGTEYVVNIAAYQMKPGEISQPLKGDNAYYIVKLVGINPAAKEAYKGQKEILRKSLLQEKQQRFFQQWLDKQKEEAEVVDYRNG